MTSKAAAGSPPIIKKVKKTVASGHHGGAWKVAYADFVTAMMAFFLLMWLLNATTEDQRKGLADYFNPSIPISKVSGGGPGALDGSSVLTENDLIYDGVGASRTYQQVQPETDAFGKEGGASHQQNDALRKIEDEINSVTIRDLPDRLSKHIQTRMTPDGLVIELVDSNGEPLYKIGSSAPSNLLNELLAIIAPVLTSVENRMAIVGHTDGLAFSNGASYSNWELSADRALTARRLLLAYGVGESQIVRVTGRADTDPISTDPLAPQNRRIAITLLTHDRAPQVLGQN